MSRQPAARVGDPIAHTMAMPGALMGIAAGVLIGALIIGTGGLGAIAVGAAIGLTGGLGLAGEYIGESMMGPPTGAIIIGSPNVMVNYRPAARTVLSLASCAKEYGVPQPQATGAATVFINRQPAGRKDEQVKCSAKIIAGSPNVFIGGPTVQVIPMTPEVPVWLNTTLQVMAIGGAIIATGGVAATYGIGTALGGLAGGYVGGQLGAWGGRAAAQALGYGETGQRVGQVLGGLGGGMLGGGLGAKGGQRFDIASNRATATNFYRSQGFAERDIPGHVSGINLARPVTVVPLAAKTPVTQYQVPGARQGNYYAPPGTQASQLGIAPNGVSRVSGLVEPKVPTTYVTTREVSVLRSTAASVNDTWSIPGTTVPTRGGGTQYFSADKGSFGP